MLPLIEFAHTRSISAVFGSPLPLWINDRICSLLWRIGRQDHTSMNMAATIAVTAENGMEARCLNNRTAAVPKSTSVRTPPPKRYERLAGGGKVVESPLSIPMYNPLVPTIKIAGCLPSYKHNSAAPVRPIVRGTAISGAMTKPPPRQMSSFLR